MVQLAIRCHPSGSAAPGELESWLERQVEELQTATPDAAVRLSRLTQSRSDDGLEVGWLVELEPADGQPLPAGHRLADTLRDMRLLGLEPTLLAPCDATANRRTG